MENKKSKWLEICMEIGNAIPTFGSLGVSLAEFFSGRFCSGIGWCSAAVAWWTVSKQKSLFDELYELFLNHLGKDRQIVMAEAYKEKLKEGGDKLSGTLAVQNGSGNCDVYRTVEDAKAACREDRGYCRSPIEERESTIRFMLSDVKDNSFNKTNEVEDGKEETK